MGLLSDLKIKLRRHRLSRRTPAEIFTHYARRNKWGDKDSLSGKGSNLESTAQLRELLPPLLRELGAKTLLDVPCGDFFWMAHVNLSGVSYLGGDIVPELIEKNRIKHERDGVAFQVIDLITGPVPKADVVFVRDCLVHLSTTHVKAALRNIRNSGSTYLLTSTFLETGTNAEIVTGQWRAIDQTKAPFNLPPRCNWLPRGRRHRKVRRLTRCWVCGGSPILPKKRNLRDRTGSCSCCGLGHQTACAASNYGFPITSS